MNVCKYRLVSSDLDGNALPRWVKLPTSHWPFYWQVDLQAVFPPSLCVKYLYLTTLGTFLLFVVWNYRLWSPAIPGRAPALTGEDSRFFVWNYRLWWPATSEPPLWPGTIPTFCCVWIYRLWSPAIPGRAPALTLLLARWRKVNSFCRLLVTRLRQLAVFTCATLDNHKYCTDYITFHISWLQFRLLLRLQLQISKNYQKFNELNNLVFYNNFSSFKHVNIFTNIIFWVH